MCSTPATDAYYEAGLFRHVPAEEFQTFIWDILDVLDRCSYYLSTMLPGLQPVGDVCIAVFLTGLLSVLLATLHLMGKGCKRATTSFRDSRHCRDPLWISLLLAFSCLQAVHGAPPVPPTSHPYVRPAIPRPTDLEVWISGQQTLREQLLRADQARIDGIPLERSAGEAAAPNFAVPFGADPEPLPAQGHLIRPDEARATHISFWVCTPYTEAETIDLGFAFPLEIGDLIQSAVDAAGRLPVNYLTHGVAVSPQIHEDFGAILLLPGWTVYSGHIAEVLDARAVQKGIFAFYLDGAVTRYAVLKQIGLTEHAEVDVFVHGSFNPLGNFCQIQPRQGGLIQVLPRGQVVHWMSELDTRLADPGRWDPTTETPQPRPGRFIALQSEEEQYIHQATRDQLPPLDVAATVFGHPAHTIWLRAPTERPTYLELAGRRIHSIVAVLEYEAHPMGQTTVLFLDLRGIGKWPQWLAISGRVFDPDAYVDGLQLPFIEEHSVVIYGGIPRGGGNTLLVEDGEVITMTLRRTANLTPTEQECPSTNEEEEEEDPDDGDDCDMLRSPSGSTPSTPTQPRGPPPPRETEDRSRSPHRAPPGGRHHDEPPSAGMVLQLQHHVDPPRFDLTKDNLRLPHFEQNFDHLFHTWPGDWLNFDVWQLPIKKATRKALKPMIHWSRFLWQLPASAKPEVHVYADGSYSPQKKQSGFGLAILLKYANMLTLFGIVGGQILGAAYNPWTFSAAPPLQAELVGLTVALLWLGQSASFLDFSHATVYFDCQAAGFAADGTWKDCGEYSQKLHQLELLLRGRLSNQLRLQYVKAHADNEWNELADVVAKQAAQGAGTLPTPPASNCQAFLRLDLCWKAAEEYGLRHRCWPGIGDGQLVIDEPAEVVPSPLTPEDLIPLRTTRTTDQNPFFSTVALSVNLQGLRGKHSYVDAQLDARHCQVAFLQETKDPGGTCHSKNYLRFGTPAESHWGVAIWIHKRLGLLQLGDSALRVDEADVQIVLQNKRLLVLKIRRPQGTIVLFSGHCPHGARVQERADFLSAFGSCLKNFRDSALIIGGLDLNGRPPCEGIGATGLLEFGEADEAGQQALPVLDDCRLWLPSTFAELHQGPSATYQHPNGPLHRLDFLVLGGAAAVHQLHSHVAEDFDTANPNADHWAVEIRLGGCLQVGLGTTSLRRPRYDRSKMLTAEGREILRIAMEHYQPPDWNVHVDEHCRHLQAYVTAVLDAHFKVADGGPRAKYIPADVWRLRQSKLRLKKKAKHRRFLWKELLRHAFCHWSNRPQDVAAEELPKRMLLYQLTATAIGIATDKIKKGISTGKTAVLDEIAGHGQFSTAQILRKARSLGIGGRQQRGPTRELPLLLDANGQPTTSRAERDQVWLQHFSQQEHGRVMTVDDYLKLAPVSAQLAKEVDWTLSDMPSVGEIEAGIRRIPRGKAMGLDMIPGEALQACPSQFALSLHPLFLKAVCGIQQPVQWRGGVLFECWKKKGSWAEVKNHRSFFISSVVGKLFHRLYRDKAQPQLQQALHGLHLGSKRQAPLTFASLYMVTHYRLGRQKKRSSGALFLDTTAAYYSILREVAMGQICFDDTIAMLFRRFNLTPADLDELRELINSGGVMKLSGVSSGVRAVVRDLHHRTWFITRHTSGDQVAMSLAGSRPGESFADAVFSFVYGKVLAKITDELDKDNIFTSYPYEPETGIFGQGCEGEPILARDATWADDSAYPVEAAQPSHLMHKIVRVCTVVLRTCKSFGLTPNLGRGKTAVVLNLVGRGIKAVREQFFRENHKAIWLPELQQAVHVEPSYVHLGGLLDMQANFLGEKRRRLALASSSYEAGKRLLYQNKSVALHTRAKLFEISILATFHNLAVWLPSGKAWEGLCDGYSRILRRLLVTHVPGDRIFRVPLDFVHVVTDSWRLELFAVRSRLSLLVSMVVAGPEALWAILQSEGDWLGVVQQDLRMLQKFDNTWPPVTAASWPQWWHAIRERGGHFKLRVKQMLQQRHQQQNNEAKIRVGLWGLYRAACDFLPQRPDETTPWSCRQCCQCFRSRAGLGAHFFKRHHRVAEYRHCATGTSCQACGKEFWTFSRLSTHLSTSSSCVNALRHNGQVVERALPGHGSKEWQRLETEQFTWAPIILQDKPVLQSGEDLWPRLQRTAYRALCDVLHEGEWKQQEDVEQAILATLAQYPLYYDEETEIVEAILQDILDLQRADVADGWSDASLGNLLAALQQLTRSLPRCGQQKVWTDPVCDTFKAFDHLLDEMNWEGLVQQCWAQHKTTEGVSVTLGADLEAVGSAQSGAPEASAVLCQPDRFVPEAIRDVWPSILQGHIVSVQAPNAFWSGPFSAPFRALKANMHSN